jgi:NarL family two-component system sensor histidine kinase YdfH
MDTVRPDSSTEKVGCYNVGEERLMSKPERAALEQETIDLEEFRQARPFYVVLMLVIVLVYGLALQSTAGLRQPERLIPFTALMVVHAALHWWVLRLPFHPRWIYPYFGLQTLLAFIIGLITYGHGAVLGLYLGLAGEAVGVLENLRRSTPIVASILGTALLNFGLALGWSSLPGWLVAVIPMAIFVMVYTTLFGRQLRGRLEAQRLLRELEAAHRQLGEYAARVEELTVTAERQRMARELHDTLAQGLAGLILQLEAADSHLGRDEGDRAQSIIRQAMLRARSTLADARRAIGQLRAEPLRLADLETAVREEAERFSAATGIPCAVEISLPEGITESASASALRAVREALTNTARHARAHHAWVEIAPQGGALAVCIRDDGVGFETDRTQKEDHYGLLGLRERARLAGGSLEVVSAPGKGTMLRLTLPMPQAETAR